jgi:hypothetical protein
MERSASIRNFIGGQLARGKGKQCDIACLLDCLCQLALKERRGAGESAWQDLSPLRDELLQKSHVPIADVIDLLGLELADLFTTEVFPVPYSGWGSRQLVQTRTGDAAGITLEPLAVFVPSNRLNPSRVALSMGSVLNECF